MPNVYFLRDDGTTPSGYTAIGSGYLNNLVLLSGTALSTGGTDTHTHSYTSWACSSVTPGSNLSSGSGNYTWGPASHNHTETSTTVDGAYHSPPYTSFRAVYRSETGWDGSVASGNIAFCETVPTGWARTESGSSDFVYISGTAGLTGGSTSHYHLVHGSTADYNPIGFNSVQTTVTYSADPHSHSFSINSASTTHAWYYWSCGMVKASTGAYIRTDVICLWDGDPADARWTAVTATNRYLKISSTNSIATGGSYLTHSHSHSVSGASAGGDTVVCDYWSGGQDTALSHTHTISCTLSSASCQPSYVVLLLYQANADFGTMPIKFDHYNKMRHK